MAVAGADGRRQPGRLVQLRLPGQRPAAQCGAARTGASKDRYRLGLSGDARGNRRIRGPQVRALPLSHAGMAVAHRHSTRDVDVRPRRNASRPDAPAGARPGRSPAPAVAVAAVADRARDARRSFRHAEKAADWNRGAGRTGAGVRRRRRTGGAPQEGGRMRVSPAVHSPLRWLGIGAGAAAGAYAAYVALTWRTYGKALRPRPEEADALLDRFMPDYEIVERHHVRVGAPPEATLAAAGALDLVDAPLVRAIFKGRELLLGARPDDQPRPHGLLDEVRSLGWVVLAELPGREIVLGAVTKPWHADVTFR